jgi:hypothetical protein
MLRAALVLLLACVSAADAQVRGRVLDAQSGDGVEGAYVRLTGRAVDRVATTASDGAYAFAGLVAGEYRLHIVHPGYDSASVRIAIGEGREALLDVPLTLRPVPVARIVVASERGTTPLPASSDSAARAPVAPAHGARATLGPQSASALADMVAADLAREPPPDREGGRRPHVLYIWGSSAERGRVMLDGASLNAPLHLGAMLPPIDPDLLATAELRSGGISPRFDGGTTHIMDFTTRPGSPAARRVWGEADLLVGRFGGELPIGASAAVIGSVRRVNDEIVDLLLGRPFGYAYADALVRADAGLGRAGHVQATVLATREGVRIPRDLDTDEAAWRNLAIAAVWRDGIGDAERRSLHASFSRGIADLPLLSAPGGRAAAALDRYAKTAQQRWSLGDHAGILGVELEHLRFDRQGRADSEPTLPPQNGPVQCTASLPCLAAAASGIAAFAETAWQPVHGVAARAGIRLAHGPGDGGVHVLPRFAATKLLGGSSAITLSAGRFSQAYAALPDDADAQVDPPNRPAEIDVAVATARATHIELNVTRRATRTAFAASAFVRHHEPGDDGAAGFVTPGFDLSWGVRAAGLNVSLGYSAVHSGAALDGRQLHQLAAVGLGANRGAFRFNVSGAYGNGLPLTPIVLERAAQPPPSWATADAGSVTAARSTLPARAFVRVDAAAGAEWRPRWNGREISIVPYMKLVNALGQRDALFYYHEAGSIGEPRPLGALPAVPVIGVRWQF